MAFTKKTWQPRVSEYPTRRVLTNVLTGTQVRYTVERDEGVVSAEGDAFSAANMNSLENRVASAFSDVADEMEDLGKSVSDGKELIADAITQKGIATASDATFATMATNILALQTLIEYQGVEFNKIKVKEFSDRIGYYVLDCTDCSGWRNFTTSNFIVGIDQVWIDGNFAQARNHVDIRTSYDSSTGQLTLTRPRVNAAGGGDFSAFAYGKVVVLYYED